MATLAEIHEQIADTIRDAIESVTDVDVQVEPEPVLNPSPPCIDVYMSSPSDDQTLAAFGDTAGAELVTVRARVGVADSDAGYKLLIAFMDDEDPLSIWAALENDETLNGLASTSAVQSRSGLIPYPNVDGGDMWGCIWNLLVVKAPS